MADEITAEDVIETICDMCEEAVSVHDIEIVYNPVVGIRELCKRCRIQTTASPVIPVLNAYDEKGIRGLKQFAAWCEYCQLGPHHSNQPGHRVTHCGDKDSPYYGIGYILRPVNRPKPYLDKNERAIRRERKKS